MVSADSTVARAHQHAADARRGPAVDVPIRGRPEVRPDIAPGGSYKFPVLTHAGSTLNCEVEFSWTDNDGEHESRHSVSLY